ncbi:helix-turn-helix domain-containing protein [Streptomyces abikoensis]|uniref:helix-turn-helix domain-containing protein n=1 Tax=Streptomyces abikoensis TaxID=97398 RepID=UPI00371081BA
MRRWLHRFNRSGLECLEDLGGQGRKPRITQAERPHIIALVKRPPPGRPRRQADGALEADDESGPPAWTLDGLTEVARKDGIEVGRSQVRRILLAEGARWCRTRTWARSNDGEKTWVHGALRVRDGKEVTMTAASRNSAFYQQILQRVENANPAGDIYVVTDNLSSHPSVSTRPWHQDHPRIHHVFIPVGACWLNLQEAWWRLLRKTALAGQSFASPDEIETATRLSTTQLNKRARPWIWGRPAPPTRPLRRRYTYIL